MDMTPQEQLDATRNVYRNAATYRDTGVVTKVRHTTSAHTSVIRFQTAFERGGRFHWYYVERAYPGFPEWLHTIWSTNGTEFLQSRNGTRSPQHGESFERLVASATGVSGGAATLILPLLPIEAPPMGWGSGTLHLHEPKDAGRETVDGVECRIIEGTTQKRGKIGPPVSRRTILFGPEDDADTRFWIGPDHLIRRFYKSQTVDPSKLPAFPGMPHLPPMDPFRTETTIDVSPFINEDHLPDSLFVPQGS